MDIIKLYEYAVRGAYDKWLRTGSHKMEAWRKYDETGRVHHKARAEHLQKECDIYYADYKRLSQELNALISAEAERSGFTGGYTDTDSVIIEEV